MKLRLSSFVMALLLLLCAAAYARSSYANFKNTRDSAISQNREVAFIAGDLTLRDLPKAQQLMAAQSPAEFFDDGQYAGDKNWYPFVTPALTAVFARVARQSAAMSLLVVTIGLNAGLILAAGALLAYLFGWKGLLALGASAALDFIGFNNGSYPIGTVRMPFALFIFVAGVLFAGPRHIPKRRWMALFALLGFLHGLIGLWQGSSFIVASFLGAVLIARWLALSGSDRRPALTAIAVYGLITGALFSLLIGPQLLQYGRYASGNEARLYLGNQYGKANSISDFTSLGYLASESGLGFAATMGFLSLLVRNPDPKTRSMAWVIGLAYVFASFMSSLGYVQNSTQAPWLGQIIRAYMPAPAHTFGYVAEFCYSLMRAIGVGVILAWLMGLFSRALSARAPKPALAAGRIALAALAMWPVAQRYWRQENNASLTVIDKETTQFAARASALIPHNAAVYGAEQMMQYAPFKILAGSAPHANPYSHPARQTAKDLLTDEDIIQMADTATLEQTLKAYDIRYAIVDSKDKTAFTRLCGAERLLTSSNGRFNLIKLSETCAYPPFNASLPLAATTPVQNAALSMLNGELQMEIQDPAQSYAMANAPAVAIAGRDFVGVRARGQAETSTCLIVGGVFRSSAQNKEIDHNSRGQTVSGAFDFTAWMMAPPDADQLIPRLVLDPACSPSGQTIRIDSISVARKSLP